MIPTGAQILEAMEGDKSLADKLLDELAHEPVHEHHHHHDHDHDEHDHEHHHDHDEHEHHHHHDHDDECSCGHDHHHDHDDDEHEHEHHHHDHDDECSCGHDHHHDHDHDCGCGHDHDHDADKVFTSWGVETPKKFTAEEITEMLDELDFGMYGAVLRAKGIVQGAGGEWLHFDYVPGESEIRTGAASYTGQICVIGAELKKDKLAELFGI